MVGDVSIIVSGEYALECDLDTSCVVFFCAECLASMHKFEPRIIIRDIPYCPFCVLSMIGVLEIARFVPSDS